MTKPNVLLIVLPYLQQSDESKAGYWGQKYKSLPSTKMKSWPALPYGILSVATYCKDVANIRIVDCNVADDYTEVVRYEMQNRHVDIVGFGMTFDNSYPHLRGLLELVKQENPEVLTVVGGAATMPVYEDILRDQPLLYAVCFGEGEIPFRALCKNILAVSANSAWITRGKLKAHVVPIKQVVSNLDDIISLDYSFVDPANYAMREEFSPFVEDPENTRRFFIVTSRGCPYRCSFCYRSRENDRKMRFASVDRVIAHVQYLVDTYGMNVLTICDDQLLVNMKRAKEIFQRLIPFKLRVECMQGESVAFIDAEMAELMYAAGMRRAVLAIESGSQFVLDTMVDKPVKLDKAKETIQILRKYGFWVTAVFVMGFPGETDEHRAETLKWIQGADLDWSTFSAAVPIKGTKLYDLCVKDGYIKGDIKLGDMDFSNYFIHTPGYAPDYVAEQIYRMNLQVNFIENRAMRIGDYLTAEKCFRQVIGMYENHVFAHYYLSECMRLTDRVDGWKMEYNRFNVIIMNDIKWRKYAEEFGLCLK